MKKTIVVVLGILVAALFLSACTAPVVIPSMPPVTDTGSVYTHEKSGFSITYPKDWTVLSDQDIQDLYAQIYDNLKLMFKDPADFEKAKAQSIPVSMAFLHPRDYAEFNPSINIMLMPMPSGITSDIVAFAKQGTEEMKKISAEGAFEFGEVKAAKVGGLDAAVLDMKMTQKGIEMVEKQYYVARNGYVAVITIGAAAASPSDLDIMQKAVDNVRFK